MKFREKLSWALVAVLGLFVAASLASVVSGGTLDPPGPPAPTLRPLDEVLSAWNIKLPSDDGSDVCQSSRFSCVFEDEAVFDRETGLVWQRIAQGNAQYNGAVYSCLGMNLGGRGGWRLPTASELRTLITPGPGDPPFLPTGHPFVQVHPTEPYWSTTVAPNQPTDRLLVPFDDSGFYALPEIGEDGRVWCVRGGQGEIH